MAEERRKLDVEGLLVQLEGALRKESELWRPLSYKPFPSDTLAGAAGVEICGGDRNRAVRWLAQLNRKFHFSPETFDLSVNILDRFLQAVKARPRHLNCIGIAAFYLAAKTVEEDEVLPSTLELVQTSGCGCSTSEVLRMERCILDKLSWDLRASTPLHFLNIFHSLLMTVDPHALDSFPKATCGALHARLLLHLQHVEMNADVFLQYAPSTLALALISTELEFFWPRWHSATLEIATLIPAGSGLVFECRKRIRSWLTTFASQARGAAVIQGSMYTPVITGRIITSAKRKVEQLSTDSDEEEEEDFYDGIKRLYNEETTAAVG